MNLVRWLADLPRVAKTCGLVFVLAVGTLIVWSSIKYYPAQFEHGFLIGRESYFYSWYAVAFYAHIVSSPAALALGVLQSIAWLRRSRPQWHRWLGKCYVWLVLWIAAPSGLAMALKAGEGLAVAAFLTLAVATWATTWVGFRAASAGRMRQHGEWMTRSFLLMCSAVMLRLLAAIVNASEVSSISYGVLAWLSWLPMLVGYELLRWRGRVGMQARIRAR